MTTSSPLPLHSLPSSIDASLQTRVEEFVKVSTKAFDSSHNHQHAEQVTYNAFRIYDNYPEKDSIDAQKLYVSAMLHDVCDHKYKELSISRDSLVEFIESLYTVEESKERAGVIMPIIDSVSYSKQSKGLIDESLFTAEDLSILRILRDADRLEAIGAIGIDRCYAFTRQSSPENIANDDKEVTKLVVQHCHDKLLRLYSEHFIVTEEGRRLALPLHEEIVAFVASHS